MGRRGIGNLSEGLGSDFLFFFKSAFIFCSAQISFSELRSPCQHENSPHQQSAVKCFSPVSSLLFGPGRERCERSGDDSLSCIPRIIHSRVCIKTLEDGYGSHITQTHEMIWNITTDNETTVNKKKKNNITSSVFPRVLWKPQVCIFGEGLGGLSSRKCVFFFNKRNMQFHIILVCV